MPRVSKRLLTWHEDRAKYVRFKLEEEIDGAAPTAIDISADTVKIYLRMWKGPSSGRTASDFFNTDTAMTKVTDGTGGNDAVVEQTVTITSAAGRPGPVEQELVLVDETVTGEPTPSTFQERILIGQDEMGSAVGARLLSSVQP